MSTLFVFDLDNTLADMRDVFARAGKEPNRATDPAAHDRWLDVVVDEKALLAAPAVLGLTELVNFVANGGHGVFLTARNEKFRGVTQAWLEEVGLQGRLFMRPQSSEDACESSAAFKEWAIRFLSSGSENVVVVDDDPGGGLEAVCARNGWTLLKVFLGSPTKGARE